MKKYIGVLLSLLLLLPLCTAPIHAAQDTLAFSYELSVDGKDTVEVITGDLITVTLYLNRTDANAPYTMHAMQDEIRYDGAFFELVPDSLVLMDGVRTTDIRVEGTLRELYMNFLSFSGGAQWQPRTRIGTFQLKVIGTSGVTTLTNEDCLVSLPDGSGSYPREANVLTVILTSECTVKFETSGGSKIDPVSAYFGETLTRPQDPVREGKQLVGWYRDIHLTKEWNFETDTVSGNMTLYAKWADAPAQDPVDPVDPTPVDPKPNDPVDPVDPKPNDPVEPVDPTPGDETGKGGWWWLLLLLLLLLAARWLYKRMKR